MQHIPNVLENTQKRYILELLWSLRIKVEKQSQFQYSFASTFLKVKKENEQLDPEPKSSIPSCIMKFLW